MQDRTLHATHAWNRQNPTLAPLDEIEARCTARLETYPETLQHTGIEDTPLRLLDELDTIDRECIAACHEHSRDTAPCGPGRRERAAHDPNVAYPGLAPIGIDEGLARFAAWYLATGRSIAAGTSGSSGRTECRSAARPFPS